MRAIAGRLGLSLLAVGLAFGSLAVGRLSAQTAPPMQLTPEPPLAAPLPAAAPPGTLCPVDPPPPTVALSMRVAAVAAPGQELEYRIRVVNRSSAAAHHVTVRNPQPANAVFVRAAPEPSVRAPELVWRLGTLPPCACREIVLVLRPTGTGDVNNCARVEIEHGQCVTTRIVRPAAPAPTPAPTPPAPVAGLSVRKTGPAQVLRYDPASFRIEVINTGAAPLSDVMVTDVLPRQLQYEGGEPTQPRKTPAGPALLSWNLGTLAPGQQRAIAYRALALEEGTFTNRAVATAAGGLRQESASRVVVVAARLDLKMSGPEQRYPTQVAEYALTVSNPGSGPATNVTVLNPVPPGTTVSIADGGQQVGNEVRWSLGTLPPRGTRTVRLRLGVDKPGEIVNRATATADRDLSATAEVKTRFEGAAGLSVRIERKNPVRVGSEFVYAILVENTGTADATGVKVTATIPVQLKITDAQAPPGSPKPAVADNKVTFEPLTLKPGKANALSYRIHVLAQQAGTVTFRVDIEARELTAGPLREDASTTIEPE